MKEKLKKIKPHLTYILAIALITSIYMFYFFNYNLPARDISLDYLPLAETLKISYSEYNDFWPLWTPYGFSGSPLLMKPFLGMDSLLGILLIIIPSTILALKLTYVLLFFLAGISMYSLMLYLKLDKRFAFISSLIYLLNAHVAKILVPGWLTTLGGYAILPLFFLFGIKTLKEKDWIKNSIITAIVLGILFRLNPDMKVAMWAGLLFGLYIIFNLVTSPTKKTIVKTVLCSLIILTLFFGLSAQRMLPNMDHIKGTSRGETSWEVSSSRQLKYNEMFNNLIEPIYKGMPQIQRRGSGDHIGIIAFLLTIFAIYKRWKDKRVLFFTMGALFSIFVASNTFNLYYLLWKFIPFFKSLRYMNRSLFLFSFCTSILAGFGANELSKKITKRNNLVYFLLVILILTNIGLLNYAHYNGNPQEWSNVKQAIKDNQILQHLSQKEELFRINTWETRGIDWGTDVYTVPLKLEHIYRYDSIWHPPYMNEYLSFAYNNPAKFWGILNLKYLTSKENINISGFKFIKKFDNCTTCFPEQPNLAKAWGPYLYENTLFLPRAHIVKNSILAVGEESAVTQTIYALMVHKDFNPTNTVIIRGKKSINEYNNEDLKKYSAIFLAKDSIDQNSNFKLKQYVDNGGKLLPDITKNQNTVTEEDIESLFGSFKGNLNPIEDNKIIMHNFDKREVKINNQEGFLVYSEKFSVFPEWAAKDNKNNKQELFNANAMASSVYLKGDITSLIFEYKPKSFIIGLYISIITSLLIASYFIHRTIKGKLKNDQIQ